MCLQQLLSLHFDGMSRVNDNLACNESQIRQHDVEGEDAHEMEVIQRRSSGKLRRLYKPLIGKDVIASESF